MIEIDCRGLSCPEPVVETKKALKKSPDGCVVLVDGRAAAENVPRFAKASGYNVEVEESNGEWIITVTK